MADAPHQWLSQQRRKGPDGSATAGAIDLNRWAALTRYIDDGKLPIDNNWVQTRIRPIAVPIGACGHPPHRTDPMAGLSEPLRHAQTPKP